MKKFAVFSGFLGSGKTTAMIALTKFCNENRKKTAMISNDLGHGVELADDRLARLSGCDAQAITEQCICYQNENLADRLEEKYAEGCELVMSDIPGFGVGALEHVYHGLSEKFPGRFCLAPFTVLVEPRTVDALREGTGGDLEYLYNTQLVEADLIVLNKRDLITDAQRQEYENWLLENYPEADCISISARTGEGLDRLADALMAGEASLKRPDIGYGQAAFVNSMSRISEYYLQYYAVVCCDTFDGTEYLKTIAESLRESLKKEGFEVPHLKLLAWEPEGDYGKVDLIYIDRPVEITRRFERPCTEIAVILNASAVCPADRFETLIGEAIETVSPQYQLELTVHKKECFGMM